MRLLGRLTLILVSVPLAGCLQSPRAVAPELDAIWCLPDGCKPTAGPYVVAVSNPEISADGSQIVLPFWCVPPEKTEKEARAVKLEVASGTWSATPYDSEALNRIENTPGEPAIPNDPSTRKSCAADCSRYAYRRLVDPKNPRYFYEVFFVENGQERQLTSFRVQGDPLDLPVLSKDGRHVAALFGGKLALVNVSNGSVSFVGFRRQVGNVCVTGHV